MSRVLTVLFALVVMGAAYVLWNSMTLDQVPLVGGLLTTLTDPGAPVAAADRTTQIVTVTSGESAAQIGSDLQARGLVRSALAFRLMAEQQGVQNELAAGVYELSPSMSTTQILQTIAKGKTRRGIVATIPEGWRATQIAERLQGLGFTNGPDFLAAVGKPVSVPGADLLGPPPPPSLEGYLFPQTYAVQFAVSGQHAAALMVQMFRQQVANQLTAAAPGSKLTPEQVVTLASIVEREARLPSERPIIASVYLNRLAIGMPLQADPTVQYAVANRDGAAAAAYGYWKANLTNADLQVASPYNTYVHNGLPPGPICSPGEASIQAVLHPAKTDYLYFVAKGDGSHLFARTLDEQNQHIQQITHGS